MKKSKISTSLDGNTFVTNGRLLLKKNVVTASIIAFSVYNATCQFLSPTVVSVAGGSNISTSGMLNWTVGEIASETYKQPVAILTQGFQQNFETGSSPGIAAANKLADIHEFSLFPNPAARDINFYLKQAGNDTYRVELYNTRGDKVLVNEIHSSSNIQKMDVTRLSPGMYLLKISSFAGKTVKTYKFVKL